MSSPAAPSSAPSPAGAAIAALALAEIGNFAVSFARINGGLANPVLGSGTLVSIDGRRGILTAAHVADEYRALPAVALILFASNRRQRQQLDLSGPMTVIVASGGTWQETSLDLAFTLLAPDVATTIEARGGVFLNMDKNLEKLRAPEPSEGLHADAMLGIVAELTDSAFVDATELVSPIGGLFHTGHITEHDDGRLTFTPMDDEVDALPASVGGMSGAGVWRVYFVEDGAARIVLKVLCGISFWETRVDHTVLCQSFERIYELLIPAVCEQLPG